MGKYHAAMVAARVADLAMLLASTFTLGHITGFVHPLDEWFDVIESGDFDYHSIDVDESALVADVEGDDGVVRGRGIFNATIYGTQRPWRLQFVMYFARNGEQWRIVRARYTTF